MLWKTMIGTFGFGYLGATGSEKEKKCHWGV